MKSLLSLFGIYLLSASPSYAADYRIAVLEFRGIDIENSALLSQLSDEIRRATLEVFPSGISIFSILTKENVIEVLERDGKSKDCLSETCEITLGRSIGADFIILGSLAEIEGVLRLSISIYDTKQSRLLGKKTLQSLTKYELLELSYQEGAKLIEKKLGSFDKGRTGRKIIPPEEDNWSVEKANKGILSFSNTVSLTILKSS